jgi:hypothetical protein
MFKFYFRHGGSWWETRNNPPTCNGRELNRKCLVVRRISFLWTTSLKYVQIYQLKIKLLIVASCGKIKLCKHNNFSVTHMEIINTSYSLHDAKYLNEVEIKRGISGFSSPPLYSFFSGFGQKFFISVCSFVTFQNLRCISTS